MPDAHGPADPRLPDRSPRPGADGCEPLAPGSLMTEHVMRHVLDFLARPDRDQAQAAAMVPVLAGMLDHANREVRRRSAVALIGLIPVAPGAREALEGAMPRLLNGTGSHTLEQAGGMAAPLRRAGPAAEPLASRMAVLLARFLRDDGVWERRTAAELLGTLGPAAAPVAPDLARAAIEEESDEVREHLLAALARVSPTAAAGMTPYLIGRLESVPPRAPLGRWMEVFGLIAALGPAASGVQPFLERIARSSGRRQIRAEARRLADAFAYGTFNSPASG